VFDALRPRRDEKPAIKRKGDFSMISVTHKPITLLFLTSLLALVALMAHPFTTPALAQGPDVSIYDYPFDPNLPPFCETDFPSYPEPEATPFDPDSSEDPEDPGPFEDPYENPYSDIPVCSSPSIGPTFPYLGDL
jgi:hypothetical protein